MHEGAIASALIQNVLEVREREHFNQVKIVTVLIGRLHHVVPAVLQNHFQILKKEYPLLAKAKLTIEIAPVQITCRACGQESKIEHPAFVCSACASIDIEISGGREMHLKEIEGTKANKRQFRGSSRTGDS